LEKDKFKNIADTANIIKEALKKADPNPILATKFVASLPEVFVFSKTLQMPKMTEKEYKEAIPTELSQFIPIPIEDLYFDYQTLIVHPNEPLADVLVVASPKKLIDDFIAMAKLADLELMALETKPLAVSRAILQENEKDAILIVHVGTEYSRISLWDGHSIRLTTTVSTGQNQIVEAMGFVGKHNRKDHFTINKTNEKDIAIPVSSIANELLNTIKYHQNRDFEPKPIKKVVVCGSALRISGLDQVLEKELKIKTEYAKIKLGNTELEPQFIAAYGLSLRNDF
jgi:type IV pilus assembly protein PilM